MATTKTRRLLPVLPVLDLRDLERTSSLNGLATSTKLKRALGDVSVELTMDGAPVLSLPIIDTDLSILNNTKLLGDRLTFDLGERFAGFRYWRMYRPNKIGGFSVEGATTTLKLWGLGAAALKGETGALRKSHAMGIEALVSYLAREVADTIDLTVVTPRPGETLPTTDVSADDGSVGDYGFSSDSAKNVTIKGHQATTPQLKEINTSLQVAVEEKAPALAVIAEMCGGIGESDFTPVVNSIGYGGVYQGDVSHKYNYFKVSDTEGMARSFLRGGKGFQGGGAIKLARENPTMDAGEIATRVEASGEPARFYGQYHAEAVQIIEQWSGKTIDLWHTVSRGANLTKSAKASQPAEWRRGTSKKAESSWAMLDRYGGQLGRRRFICGSRLVMARDQDLILATPHQTITPTDAALTERISIDDNMAAGVQTVDLVVLRESWITPPGGVVQLAEFGPANGPWLVQLVTAQASLPTLAVTLTQPTTQVPAPATKKKAAAKTGGAAISDLLNTGKRGKVVFATSPPANKPGQNVVFETLRFVEIVAGIYDKTLIVTCGTNHKRLSVDGLVSDHFSGHATDIGMAANGGTNDGPVGDAIATAALMAAGYSRAKAARAAQQGGLYTIPNHSGLRIQVIWKTNEGGNHHDHVHIGARPA